MVWRISSKIILLELLKQSAESDVLVGFTLCPLEVNIYMSLHVGLGIRLTHIS